MLALLMPCALLVPVSSAQAEALFDPEIRSAMLKRKDGQIAHIETVYSDIFILKYQNLLTMTFHRRRLYFHEIRPKRAAIVIRIRGKPGAPIANWAPTNCASRSWWRTTIATKA